MIRRAQSPPGRRSECSRDFKSTIPSDALVTPNAHRLVSSLDMSITKQIVSAALISILAGLTGGMVAVRVSMRGSNGPDSADVVRAKMFEVIGSDGRVRARFGVHGGDEPTMILLGSDGKERLSVGLDNVDEPQLVMSDIRGNPRAFLGHVGSDTASVDDDDWGLSLRGTGSSDLAEFAVIKSYPSHKYRGTQTGYWLCRASYIPPRRCTC
jgi:hypothetical protein